MLKSPKWMKVEKYLKKKYYHFRINNLAPYSFSESPLIVHFAYHKCLTAYCQRIFRGLSRQFYFKHQHCTSKAKYFNDEIIKNNFRGIISVNNRTDIAFDQFPEYRGSHFLRDPRDLIISGYNYHLWTTEKWAHEPFPWDKSITSSEVFKTHIDIDPGELTYQEFLNEIGKEKGIILEMIWRKGHFEAMENWDYKNEKILELKYESILGNEAETFSQLFDHYGFNEKVKSKGLELVEQFSLKKFAKKDKHIQHGGSKQWEKHFSAKHFQVFNEMYPTLLTKTQYSE